MQSHPLIQIQAVTNHQQRNTAYFITFSAHHPTPQLNDYQHWLNTFCPLQTDNQTQWRMGNQTLFINISPQILLQLPAYWQQQPQIVWVLDMVSAEVSEAQLLELKHWQQQKIKIAVRLSQSTGLSTLPTSLIETLLIDENQVNETLRWPLKKLMATEVHDRATFKRLSGLGCQQFIGEYVLQPESHSSKTIQPGFDSVLHILNLVSQDADNRTIEHGFKRDTTLSYKLLRYINSVGFGLSCEVQSLNHALTILGRNQLYRWLTLLMVTAGSQNIAQALMKTSVLRGRMTELLGYAYLEKNERDHLFVVGVFSLLDIILNLPLREALEKLQLSTPVMDALLNSEGIYAPFLTTTLAMQRLNTEQVLHMQQQMHLPADVINQAMIEAMLWTETLEL